LFASFKINQKSSSHHIITMARANSKSPAKKIKKKTSVRSDITSIDRIVQAIASRVPYGDTKPTRKMIMGMALVTNKRSFNTTILNIKKKHRWVDYDTDSVWLTQEGKDHVGPDIMSVPANNDAMQDKIRMEVIKGIKPRQIYDFMLDGGWYSRAELAVEMNLPDNKSFGTYISSLSKVVERQNGRIRLSDMVFPCGRPSDNDNGI
jgi:hypothetical protein